MLCTEVDVFNMLNALDTTKACGPDGITGKMLKMTASSITPVLTKLFNLSIATGTVPTAWKTSTLFLSPSAVLIPQTPQIIDQFHYYRYATRCLNDTSPFC